MSKGRAEKWAHRVLKGVDVETIPLNLVLSVASHLESRKEGLIERGDYLGAQALEDKISALKQFSEEATYDSIQDYRLTELRQRLSSAKQDLAVSIARRDSVIESFLQKKEQALAECDAIMQRELDEFDRAHEDAKPPPKFRRFSPEYLNMRRREKAMVAAKRYVDANAVKEEADRIERREMEQNERNWKSFVAKQRDQLLKRQLEQRRIIEAKWDKEWASVLPSGDEDVTKCQNAVRAIEARISELSLEPMPAELARGTASRGHSPRRRVSPSLSPRQNDQLRSRMRYVRTMNYKKVRMRQVRSEIARRVKC